MITYLAGQTRRLALPKNVLKIVKETCTVREIRKFSAINQEDRDSLIAEAFKVNVEKKQIHDTELFLEKDLPDIQLPHNVKLRPRDSLDTRKWKLKQQFYYEQHQKFGYVDDILVKKGWLSGEMLTARRAFVDEQMSRPASSRDPSVVDVDKLMEVQAKYEVAEELKINEEDSVEVKKKKAMGQLQSYIEQTQQAIDEFPDATEHLKELRIAHKKLANATEEEVELFLIEKEDQLKEETKYSSLEEFMRENTHRMMDVMEQQMNDPLNAAIKHQPLEQLGLIKQGAIDAIDDQLTMLVALQKKRMEEYTLRFGAMPEDEELEAAWEREADRQHRYDLTKMEEVKSVAASEKKLDEDAEALAEEAAREKVAEEKIAEGGENVELGEEGAEEETIPQSVATKKKTAEDIEAFQEEVMAGMPSGTEGEAEVVEESTRVSLDDDSDSEEEFLEEDDIGTELLDKMLHLSYEGPAPPKIDLSKYTHLKDLPYDQFEEAPTEFETYIMDEFAREQQRTEAKNTGVTLFPRIPVPSGPQETSWVKKALLLYRIRAMRVYIDNLHKRKKQEQQRQWRDLDLLPTDLDDPDHPWKLELYDECKLRLNNTGLWTTQQKEDFLRTLHHMLSRPVKEKGQQYTLNKW